MTREGPGPPGGAGPFVVRALRADSADSFANDNVEQTRESPGGMAVYGRQRGGVGKLGSALGWFRNLSSSAKRRILLGAAIPTILAFAIGMGAITGFEAISGQPLSCTFGGNCQTASAATGQSAPQTTLGRLTSSSGSSGGVQDNSGERIQQTPTDGSQSQNGSGGGLLDNLPGGNGGNQGVPNNGGQTPVYEQPAQPSQPSGGGVPTEEVPTEEVPTEQAPVTPAVPSEQPSSGGVEAVPTE